MTTIVVIDDTQSILQLVSLYLKAAGYQVLTAADGAQGLRVVQENHPDLIITDVMMPGMDGYELTRRLRRDPLTTRTPILTLTAHSQLESKIKAFEAGADDFMTKPFDAGELVARVNVLLRRAAVVSPGVESAAEGREAAPVQRGQVMAVHSLRGGVGCSSLAVNLALGLAGLWDERVLLADFVTTTGQLALMLNLPLKRTWADIMHIPVAELALDELEAILAPHASGVRVLMAPTDPTQSANMTGERAGKMLELLRAQYGYVIADVTHDFNDIALQVLDAADRILLTLAPDLASIRAAAATLETYAQLGYPKEKITVGLNWTFGQQGFARQEIEEALAMPLSFVMPYAPLVFVSAINRGMPPVFEKPEEPVAAYLEDLAFLLSRPEARAAPPTNPKPGWRRVQKRIALAARK
ncbi:MAG: response regulator [Chloroflexi bacterium]|nr:response regulator [Chloroflexota bacterium]